MKYVIDTSALIKKAVTNLLKEKKISGTLIIPHAVIAELESQGNRGLEIGFIGLEEIQDIRTSGKLAIEFMGERPTETQIKYAKSGEIDAIIREIAFKEKAILITGDKVQAESGKAFGLEVIFLEREAVKQIFLFEKYFDDTTMSIHIKEDSLVYAKRGKPGEWTLITVGEQLSGKEIETMAKEVIENSRLDPKTFVEISRGGMTIVQARHYRIVIVRPPISDGWEMTIVKPLKKLDLDAYHLHKTLFDRLKEKSRGILVAGEPDSGKSTFVQALAEFYLQLGRIVKTVESPRDLQLSNDITQYSKNFASSEDIHDILFLSRVDHIIFDEMRDSPDFRLYSDLRLAGSECIGVIHSSSPIDAVQRFITRIDVGTIPSVIDTILFIERGGIKRVLSLKMLVKVPTGMIQDDLARPVVEVRDFETNKLEYEIYSYGEETVVIPVEEETKSEGIKKLAARSIEDEMKRYTKNVQVEVVGNTRAIVYVPEEDISRVIGKEGSTITRIEKILGISIDVKELKEEKRILKYSLAEDKKNLKIFVEPGIEVEIFVRDKLLLTGYSSKRGEVRINKNSNIGRELLTALKRKDKIDIRG